jgi:hypothetical protein
VRVRRNYAVRREENVVEGRIVYLSNEGSIMVVGVETESGEVKQVFFDWHMFERMHEAEGGAIKGRRVRVMGNLGTQFIEFLD